MIVVIALLLLVVGTCLLLVGSDWFLDGAGDLARMLGISALVLGVLLAGLEPEEILTAAIASARGAPALAVGNVVGTNVTIVTAALGLSALLFPMMIHRNVRRQAMIATLVSVLPMVLLFLGTVTQVEGLLLLVVFAGYCAGYLGYLFHKSGLVMATTPNFSSLSTSRARFSAQLFPCLFWNGYPK